MSEKGIEKKIRFCVLHERGEWRTKSTFARMDYAVEDKSRGVFALFEGSNSYLNEKGYSLPMFALVWDEQVDDDAYVYRKNKAKNNIESKRIKKELAELYRKTHPDVEYLKGLFSIEEMSSDTNLFDDISSIMSLEASEREMLINARVGQGKFRQDVIRVWGSETCALTLTPVKGMLIASHIKAWRNCDDTKQRLDGANGILLCAHIDRLFDQNLVTFKKVRNEYRLKLSDKLDRSLLKQLGIVEGDALATGKLKADDISRFEKYLEHHQNLFDQLNIKV